MERAAPPRAHGEVSPVGAESQGGARGAGPGRSSPGPASPGDGYFSSTRSGLTATDSMSAPAVERREGLCHRHGQASK